jgi:hypothetical protein
MNCLLRRLAVQLFLHLPLNERGYKMKKINLPCMIGFCVTGMLMIIPPVSANMADDETVNGSVQYSSEQDGFHFESSFPLLAQTQNESSGKDGEEPEGDESLDASNADEMARKSSNPLGGEFTILVNQFDNYFMEGDITDKTRNINSWLFQPIISVPMPSIGKDWIWVNRPTFSYFFGADVPDIADSGLLPGDKPENSDIPPGKLPFKSESGFGDFVHLSLLGQSLPQDRWGGGDFVWALGPTLMFPTASEDELGTGKYSAGPAGALGFIGSKFIGVALFQHWWDYASDDDDRDDVNYSWLNLRYLLNLSGGWQVGGTPEITVDW